MVDLRALCGFAACVALALQPGRVGAEPRFERVELRPHDALLGAASRDLDGDGRPELLVASAEELGPEALQRHVTLHRWSASGALEKWAELRVPDDVVAYGALPHPGGAPRILYATPGALFALEPESGAVERVVDEHRLFATMPSPRELPFWEGAGDLNGDGRSDLWLPDARGYAIYLQGEDGAFAAAGRVDPGFFYASEPTSRRRRLARSAGEIVQLRALNPVVPAELSGDGRPDLVALDSGDLLGFEQRAGAPPFQSEPSLRQALLSPSADRFANGGRGRRADVELGDVDGDGRSDFVVAELDPEALVTRLRIFMGGPEGPPEQPSQILKLGSLGGEPELVDLNGDGRLDLGVTTVRTDRLRALAGGAAQLEFTYYGFLSRSGGGAPFSTSPDLQWDLAVEIEDRGGAEEGIDEEDLEEGGGDRRGFIRCAGDFDGDGVRDLARLGALGELSVYAGRVSGESRESLSISDELLLRAQEPLARRVEIRDLDGDGRSDVALHYEDALVLLMSRS